jgi:poly(3-hydroxybutyrate) depolymerase
MTTQRLATILALLASLAEPALAASITKDTLEIDRDSRTYYLFVPDSLGSDPAPLLITLHGSGRDGRPLVDAMRGLASKQHFNLVDRTRPIDAAGRCRPTVRRFSIS